MLGYFAKDLGTTERKKRKDTIHIKKLQNQEVGRTRTLSKNKN